MEEALTAYKQKVNYSCGAARVRSLVKYFEGIELKEKDLRKQLNTQKDIGTSSDNIIKFFRKRGYKVNEKHGMTLRSVRYWLRRGVPVLVAFDTHWWLLFRIDEVNAYLMEDNLHAIPILKFMRKWFDRDGNKIPYAHYGIVVRK